MYPNDMPQDAARSAGHVGNFHFRYYWVARKISEFENMAQDGADDVIRTFFIGRENTYFS